jgi:hypothetical protein
MEATLNTVIVMKFQFPISNSKIKIRITQTKTANCQAIRRRAEVCILSAKPKSASDRKRTTVEGRNEKRELGENKRQQEEATNRSRIFFKKESAIAWEDTGWEMEDARTQEGRGKRKSRSRNAQTSRRASNKLGRATKHKTHKRGKRCTRE